MSEELTPMNHRELWLQAIATGTVPEWLEPMTHEELWLKAIAQGGGANNIVHVDYTHEKTSSGDTWTLTKTAGEILSLLKSGNIVFIQVDTDEYYQLAGVQRLGANSQVFQFPCIDPNPTSQSNLTYPKIAYKKGYQANGLTAYPTYVANSGGNAD